jgi:hypothetical protein
MNQLKHLVKMKLTMGMKKMIIADLK